MYTIGVTQLQAKAAHDEEQGNTYIPSVNPVRGTEPNTKFQAECNSYMACHDNGASKDAEKIDESFSSCHESTIKPKERCPAPFMLSNGTGDPALLPPERSAYWRSEGRNQLLMRFFLKFKFLLLQPIRCER